MDMPTNPKGPRPSYTNANNELRTLRQGLQKILDDNQDVNGKDLTEVQQSQINNAIREIDAARTLLACIQDQAPYKFQP